jgi:hypothetical protein
MDERKTPVDRIYSRIRKNPVVASLIILGSIVVALSTFTNASRNLLDLFDGDTRPDINGLWTAEVKYDWKNANYVEKFSFQGEGGEVYGTASFLEVNRGILEGEITENKLRFVTITQEVLDTSPSKDSIHEYRGQISGSEIRFVLQTRGGYSAHVPVEFIARKMPKHENP